MSRSRWFRTVLAVCAALLAWQEMPAARADLDPAGPPIGNVAYQAAISAADDADEFVGSFLVDDTFSVTVTALRAGRSAPTLRPVVEIVDPGGVASSFGAATSRSGLAVTFRNYRADQAGVWAVRVRGADGTVGPYSARFSVKPRRASLFKAHRLGAGAPYTRNYPFGGFDGAVISARATWRRGSAPVEFRALNAPDGGGVTLASGENVATLAVRRGSTVTLSNVTLSSGAGTYGLVTHVEGSAATYDITIDLRAPRRVASRRPARLSDAEPQLDAREFPVWGAAGSVARFTGRNFSAGTPPVVRFGRARATSVTVGGGGTWLECVVPPREGSIFVPIYVTNPDGQAVARDAYFSYQPPPTISDLVDAATRQPVRGASTAGGRAVVLTGTNFADVYTLQVGGVRVTSSPASPDEWAFPVPALPAGTHPLTLSDPFGRTITAEFTLRAKVPPSFTAAPYSPSAIRVGTPTTVTVAGANFAADDVLSFGGAPVAAAYVGPGLTRFDVPASPAGSYSLSIEDSVGTVVNGPPVVVKAPAVISSVTLVGGPFLGTRDVAIGGGAIVRVDGASFAANDTVYVGGSTVGSFVTNTATRKEFLAPAASFGLADLVIADGAGQVTTERNAFNYVGFRDDTDTRLPPVSTTDDFGAKRIAVADLDLDGEADDLVLASPGLTSIGLRTKRTRVLIGSSGGTFTDTTDAAPTPAIPAPSGTDTWTADCLAVGDLDLTNGPDVVIGGIIAGGTTGAQVRLLKNGGGGAFTLSAAAFPGERSSAALPSYTVTNPWGYYYATQNANPVFTAMAQAGSPQGLALGDLDRDGDLDVVMGTDHFQSRTVYYDPAGVVYVTAYVLPSYNRARVASVTSASAVNYRQYTSALRVFRNDRGTAPTLTDVSATRVPSPGDSKSGPPTVPALHCRDLALGDLDMDGDLDVVVAWNDPSTVTCYGLSTKEATGSSKAGALVATRVLLNDGAGGLTNDATATWMPGVSNPDYWQADRVVLSDLDGDGDTDLVLLLANSVDAWKGTPTRTRRCLRVLRNDRNRFVDVTASALPAVSVAENDDFRGDAILVRDVNADGRPDILVATTQAMFGSTAVRRTSFRTFFGTGVLTWSAGAAFSAGTSVDTGEASDIAVSATLDALGEPVFLFANSAFPSTGPLARKLRTEKWRR